MRDDSARTSAFYEAIDALAPGKLVLDLGTGALALLALRCARAGAQHVYAVEGIPAAAAAARLAVGEAGLDDRITVLEGRSTELELPARVDLVVHEVIGEIASREGVALSFRDAARRHVKAEVVRQRRDWSMPRRAATWIAPATLPPPSYWQDRRAKSGTLLLPPSREARTLRLPEFPVGACALAPPQLLEDLDFGAEDFEEILQHQERRQRYEVSRSGTLGGFSLHVTVECLHGVGQISSAKPGSHWANVFVVAPQAVDVEEGDAIDLEAKVDLQSRAPTYTLHADLHRRGALMGSTPVPVLPRVTFQ